MKKTRFIALALVAAIALMGAGYAAWQDQLTMDTEVKTGFVDVCFWEAGEKLAQSSYVTADIQYEQDSQDEDNGNGQSNWDLAHVKIGNMYPSAKADVTVRMNNNSTIPVSIEKLDYEYSNNWGARDVNFAQVGATLRFYDKDGNAVKFNGNDSVYANPWEPKHTVGTYIPVGGYATLSFNFKALDGVDELSTYTFTVHPTFTQFINQ